MTAEKIIEVCEIYTKELSKGKYRRSSHARVAHVRDHMLPLTNEFAQDGRIEKAFRWLGFIQGVLWCEGVYTIEELKNHNRPLRIAEGDS